MRLRAVHVGEQDVVPVCPVNPAVDIVHSERGRSVCVCTDDHSWIAAVHSHPSDVWVLAAVDPKNIAVIQNKTLDSCRVHSVALSYQVSSTHLL